MTKPFGKQSGYTVFNNVILDTIMPGLKTGNDWKILTLIIRKTVGWNKERDQISQSQIKKCTGISSTNTILASLERLVNSGLITYTPGGGVKASSYALNLDYVVPPPIVTPPPEVDTLPPPEVDTLPPPKNAHTKESLLKKDSKENTLPNFADFLKLWKQLFPNKPQPRQNNTKLKVKWGSRLNDTAFTSLWVEALTRASESATCRGQSWFDATFFLKNQDNWEKCQNRWMQWKDDQTAEKPAKTKIANNHTLWETAVSPWMAESKLWDDLTAVEQAAVRYAGASDLRRLSTYEVNKRRDTFIANFNTEAV